MKTHLKILVAGLALSVGAGCASESGGGGTAAVPAPGPAACTVSPTACVTPVPTPVPVPTNTNSVTLNLVSTSQLGRMFFNANPNNPTNVTITLNLTSSQDSVLIKFVDRGQNFEAGLGTTHPTNGGVSDNSFNHWYTDPGTGKQVWKGFFQDQFGAVIIIIDRFLTLGDGSIGNILGGSVWFQNFNRFYPNFGLQGSQKMCWQISMGPYDCRTWIGSGDGVYPDTSYYPNNRGPDANMNYEKLGDFDGLSKTAIGL